MSLGEYTTVGSLMGFLVGKNLFIEGYFARLMYRSLYKMHEYALHGASKTFLGALARGLSRGARAGGEAALAGAARRAIPRRHAKHSSSSPR